MERITLSLDDDLLLAFDALVATQGYTSRSEAFRDLARRALDERRIQARGDEACVANVSYVYDHHARDLAGRLTALQHDRHDLVLSTTHVHLDHDNCLESTLLRGPLDAIVELGDKIMAERGVRFGAINLVSASALHNELGGRP